MTMTYHQPRSREEAAALLAADPSARILAGGTDLIVQMRSGRIAPGAIVDIKRISAMQAVMGHDGGFTIGAAMPCTGLKQSEHLTAAWPGVVEAANLIGSVQVRNRATMAGNLCNASPAADAVPALIAAGATALVVGPQGERLVPVEEIPAGPGKTTLAAGEFIAELRLPPRPQGGGDAYLRATPRTEMDIAIVGVGVALVIGADGICTAARVALGAVAPTAILVPEAGAALVGTRVDDTALDAMEKAARAACRPIGDKRGSAEYRTHMAGVLARRGANIALVRAKGEQA
jgi:CO/xanthine dehydrogenase FAD-binding subunit